MPNDQGILRVSQDTGAWQNQPMGYEAMQRPKAEEQK